MLKLALGGDRVAFFLDSELRLLAHFIKLEQTKGLNNNFLVVRTRTMNYELGRRLELTLFPKITEISQLRYDQSVSVQQICLCVT